MQSNNLSKYCVLLLFYCTCLTGLISVISTLVNAVTFWKISHWYINIYLLIIIVGITIYRVNWGLIVLILMLPLSVGLGFQLNAHIKTSFMLLPNPGLDLVSGFLVGFFINNVVVNFSKITFRNAREVVKFTLPHQYLNYSIQFLAPVFLLNLLISISTIISISRNLYQSASGTSIGGVIFNLIYFRPIGWHDDFVPIADCIFYSLSFTLIIVVVHILIPIQDKNKFLFRPIIAGLLIASIIGLLQSLTGMGLSSNLLVFRKDYFGYAAIGLQPDIHAYAGHMILGALGLLGYLFVLPKGERKVVIIVTILSWVGLILSKSRSTFIFALLGYCTLVLVYLHKSRRKLLLPVLIGLLILISIIGYVLLSYADRFSGIPVLSWFGEVISELKSRGFNSWSLWSGVFGARFEIWEGALRMWLSYPFFGIGQGDFYRLSAIAPFSRSNYLILNNGENAHNYFLQTLTETGVIGVAGFIIFVLYPFIISKKNTNYLPSLIALFGLSLANIFSHSFLVRENLFIAMLLFALLYADAISKSSRDDYSAKNETKRILNGGVFSGFVVFLLIIYGVYEIYNSYNKLPFEYGRFCFVKSPVPDKDWTSGSFIIDVPRGFDGVKITLKTPRAYSKVKMTSELFSYAGEGSGLIDSYTLNGGETRTIYINLSEPLRKIEQGRLVLTLSECFIPRNLGQNVDSRRLGVYVTESSTFKSSVLFGK